MRKKDQILRNSEEEEEESGSFSLERTVLDKLEEVDRDMVHKTQISIHNIQMIVMVAIIYQVTRSYDNQDKKVLENFFNRVVEDNDDKFSRE